MQLTAKVRVACFCLLSCFQSFSRPSENVCVLFKKIITINLISCSLSAVYGNTLESDLKGDTSGDLETILVELNKVRMNCCIVTLNSVLLSHLCTLN